MPPFIFASTASLIAGLAALPPVDGGFPIANRIWWARGFSWPGSAAPGVVLCPNSDIRGDFNSGMNTRNQQFIDAPAVALNFIGPKRLQDVEINSNSISAGGLVMLGDELYMENVSVIAPVNGIPGPSPIAFTSSQDGVVDRCVFNDPGLGFATAFGNIVTLIDDNVFTAGSLSDDSGGAGPFVTLAIKGTGNFISPSAPSGSVVLDVDIGGQASSVTGLPFSGAESMTFGCGPFTFPPGGLPPFGPGGDGPIMYPGGGNAGDAAPVLLSAGTLITGIAAKKAAVLRGIYLVAEAPTPVFVDVDVYQAGVLVMTEPGVFLSPFGSYSQTAFAFITGPAFPVFAPGDIFVVIREPAAAGTSWTSMNVTLLLK